VNSTSIVERFDNKKFAGGLDPHPFWSLGFHAQPLRCGKSKQAEPPDPPHFKELRNFLNE
jgi:hypothetical protein